MSKLTSKIALPIILVGLFAIAVDSYRPKNSEQIWRQLVNTLPSSNAYEESAYFAGLGKVLDRSGVQSVSGQFMLLGKLEADDNAFGDYCKWIVRINMHQFKTFSGLQAGGV